MPDISRHRQLEQLARLQKLTVVASERTLADSMIASQEASSALDKEQSLRDSAQENFDALFSSDMLSLDMFAFKSQILLNAEEQVEIAETSVAATEIAEEDNRMIFFKSERQLSHLQSIAQHSRRGYQRKVDDKKMTEAGAMVWHHKEAGNHDS